MPILRSAKKALRVSLRKKAINLKTKEKLKKALKSFKKQPLEKNLRLAFSALDKAVKKKIISRNKAARLKAQWTALKANRPNEKRRRSAKTSKRKPEKS